MPQPLIPRRRFRRRSWSRRAVFVAVAFVVTAILIGGLTRVSRQSGPYDTSLNRSFAAQGAVISNESNTTASDVRHLMAQMRSLDRTTLQSELDSVVQQTNLQATRATSLAVRASSAGANAQFAAVFSDRAAAMSQLRAAVDGLLGMHPLPIAGAPAPSGTAASTPTLLSSTVATNRIAAAGVLLAQSDRRYRALRHSLARSMGHAMLPASVWVTDAQEWQIGSVATEVDLVESSASLAATHRLILRTVQLSPQALPSPSGVASSTVSVLSPTTRVVVSVVVANQGSVDEPHASVQFTLTPLSGGATATVTRNVAIATGGSITLPPASFVVKPGHSYRLNVAIVLPAAQSVVSDTSVTQVLQIAPST